MREKIISIGEVLWDLFPEGSRFGGAPANFACHAAVLGGQVAMLSAVGCDQRGEEALSLLQKFGVDTSLIQRVSEAPTGSVEVSLDANGKPTFKIHEDSAWDHIRWKDHLESLIGDADAVYFGTLGQRSEVSRSTILRCMNAARATGAQRILDVNLRSPFFDHKIIRDSIQHANILKLSDDELIDVCLACGIRSSDQPKELILQLLHSQSLDVVVMTRGAKGALLASSEGIVEQPGIPTIVRDTVGAGDAFLAAFSLGLLRRQSYEQNLFNACSIAAKVCTYSGSLPDETSA